MGYVDGCCVSSTTVAFGDGETEGTSIPVPSVATEGVALGEVMAVVVTDVVEGVTTAG